MRTTLIIVLFISVCFKYSSAQIKKLDEKEINEVLIETGEYKNYYEYDLGDFIFYNGRRENNLTFKILNKKTNHIEYTYRDSISDAMIHNPMFFSNAKGSIIVILVEVAAESSWGQLVLLITKGTIKYLGYLNYTVNNEIGESISEYCFITEKNDQIILGFEDIPILSWDEDAKIINGKELKFELGMNGLRRIN